MKICEYCGSQCKDDESKCASCGGDSFQYACNNCGTTFKDGLFCPKCGVKTGETGKICPQCQTRYFTPACPNCGYVYGQNRSNTVIYPAAPARKPGGNIVLWILGWIFIFPVPLTVLVVRNRNIQTALKILIIVVAWLAYFALAVLGNAEEETEYSANQTYSYSSTVEESGLQGFEAVKFPFLFH